MSISLTQAQAQLDAWLAASLAVAQNQMYRMADGRELRRADAAAIKDQIVFWQSQVQSLTSAAAGGRRRIRYVVPS